MNDEHYDPRLDRTAILYPNEPAPVRLRPPSPPPPVRPAYRRRRLRSALCALLIVSLVLGAGLSAYLYLRLDGVRRVSPGGLAPATGPMTVLLVGSDSRAELTPGQESRFGSGKQVSGKRSDVIMVLRTDPGQNSATVISIPRDLYVPIAGTGKSGRINGAYAGGPERLIRTVSGALGIPINHYVEVNFDGFRRIVDSIGGLNVFFPNPARDILAELNVPTAGCVHLTGDQGLAFVRSRRYEYLENGTWKTDPTSDYGRIIRQQDFIRRMVSKAGSRALRSPRTANSLLNSVVREVTLDAGLGTVDLVRLGNTLRSLAGGGLEMLTLPTSGARIGGASVLRTKQPEAAEMVRRFLNPPPPQPEAVSPASVTIRVLNGSGRPGEAGSAAAGLKGLGFMVKGTGDAARTAFSVVRYSEGNEPKARVVQPLVGGGAEVKLDPALKNADVVLVTGTGFSSINPPAAGAAPATPPPTQIDCPA